jgi:hypothetical protein
MYVVNGRIAAKPPLRDSVVEPIATVSGAAPSGGVDTLARVTAAQHRAADAASKVATAPRRRAVRDAAARCRMSLDTLLRISIKSDEEFGYDVGYPHWFSSRR